MRKIFISIVLMTSIGIINAQNTSKSKVTNTQKSTSKGCKHSIDYNVYVIASSNGDLQVSYESDSYGNQIKTYQFLWFQPNGILHVYIGKTASDAYRTKPDIRKWECQGEYILSQNGWGQMTKYHLENGKKDLLPDYSYDTFLKYWGQH